MKSKSIFALAGFGALNLAFGIAGLVLIVHHPRQIAMMRPTSRVESTGTSAVPVPAVVSQLSEVPEADLFR